MSDEHEHSGISLGLLLPLLLLAEFAIVGWAHSYTDSLGEVFQLSARWSGRLSFIVFLFALLSYAQYARNRREQTLVYVSAFCIIHFIHLFLLGMNIHLNEIELIPTKVAGGALAYGMILVYPFVFRRVKRDWIHLCYFLYVSFVMTMTYLARARGDFEGAEPELIHQIGLGMSIGSMVYLLYRWFANRAFNS